MKTTEQFIKEANIIHNNKYGYSKVNYVSSRTKVCIICPKHGEFWQTPNSHLNGSGCPLCSKQVYDTNSFIVKAKEIHGNRYDYSKVEYKGSGNKVCIICPIHGEFWQTPANHLHKTAHKGCPKCKGSKISLSKRKKMDIFLDECNRIHGNKYDYSKVEYVNTNTKVCIICPKHGEFWQTPANHLKNHGCPQCAFEKNKDVNRSNLDSFIAKANEIHNNRYDYSKVGYRNCKTKVCIICSKHGEFWQTPQLHLSGCGCPNCQQSRLENKTKLILDKLNIENIQRCDKSYFDWLGLQHLDFYLPKYNIAIECQGIQHYKPIEHFGGEEKFKLTKKLDEEKRNKVKEHNIKLVYINYNFNDEKIKSVIENIYIENNR